MPVSMLIEVVLPAPLCPKKVKTSPVRIESVKFLTAIVLPNTFVRF